MLILSGVFCAQLYRFLEMDVRQLIDELDVELRKCGAVAEVLCEVGGFPVMGYKLERPEVRSVYLSSGIHGDEPAGPLALLKLVKEGLLDRDYSWYICPVLNPVGLVAGTRGNADGLDLNRDYLKCDSEEIVSHVQWLNGVNVDLAISLHEDWESTGFYFYEINQLNDRPERYESLVGVVSEYLPMEPENEIDGHEVRESGWIYHVCDADEPTHWPEAIYLSSVDLNLRVRVHAIAVVSILDLF